MELEGELCLKWDKVGKMRAYLRNRGWNQGLAKRGRVQEMVGGTRSERVDKMEGVWQKTGFKWEKSCICGKWS